MANQRALINWGQPRTPVRYNQTRVSVEFGHPRPLGIVYLTDNDGLRLTDKNGVELIEGQKI